MPAAVPDARLPEGTGGYLQSDGYAYLRRLFAVLPAVQIVDDFEALVPLASASPRLRGFIVQWNP